MHQYDRQTQGTCIDHSVARGVRQHQFSDGLVRAIGGLRALQVVVIDIVWQQSAEHRDRAWKDQAGRGILCADGIDQFGESRDIHGERARRVLFCGAGQHSRQMEHAMGLPRRDLLQRIGCVDAGLQVPHTWVGCWRQMCIEKEELLDCLACALSIGERACLKKRRSERPADEATGACDQDPHEFRPA